MSLPLHLWFQEPNQDPRPSHVANVTVSRAVVFPKSIWPIGLWGPPGRLAQFHAHSKFKSGTFSPFFTASEHGGGICLETAVTQRRGGTCGPPSCKQHRQMPHSSQCYLATELRRLGREKERRSGEGQQPPRLQVCTVTHATSQQTNPPSGHCVLVSPVDKLRLKEKLTCPRSHTSKVMTQQSSL